MPVPLKGDRSAYDVLNYPLLHSNDFAVGDSHHAEITIDAGSGEMFYLNGQELELLPQGANTVLAGPTSGADATPGFRYFGFGELSDVTLTDEEDDDVMVYDLASDQWINTTLTGSMVYIINNDAILGASSDVEAGLSYLANDALGLLTVNGERVGGQTQMQYFATGISVGEAVTIGEADVDGSWRLVVVGSNLSIERRESGVWVSKQTISS